MLQEDPRSTPLQINMEPWNHWVGIQKMEWSSTGQFSGGGTKKLWRWSAHHFQRRTHERAVVLISTCMQDKWTCFIQEHVPSHRQIEGCLQSSSTTHVVPSLPSSTDSTVEDRLLRIFCGSPPFELLLSLCRSKGLSKSSRCHSVHPQAFNHYI